MIKELKEKVFNSWLWRRKEYSTQNGWLPVKNIE